MEAGTVKSPRIRSQIEPRTVRKLYKNLPVEDLTVIIRVLRKLKSQKVAGLTMLSLIV